MRWLRHAAQRPDPVSSSTGCTPLCPRSCSTAAFAPSPWEWARGWDSDLHSGYSCFFTPLQRLSCYCSLKAGQTQSPVTDLAETVALEAFLRRLVCCLHLMELINSSMMVLNMTKKTRELSAISGFEYVFQGLIIHMYSTLFIFKIRLF